MKTKKRRKPYIPVALLVLAGLLVSIIYTSFQLEPNLVGRVSGFFVIAGSCSLLLFILYLSYFYPLGVANLRLFTPVVFILFSIVTLVQLDLVLTDVELPGHCGEGFSTGNCFMVDGLVMILYVPVLFLSHFVLLVLLSSNFFIKKRRLRRSAGVQSSAIKRKHYQAVKKSSKIFLFVALVFGILYMIMAAYASWPPRDGPELAAQSAEIINKFKNGTRSIAAGAGLSRIDSAIHDVCYRSYDYAIYDCSIRITTFYGVRGNFREGMDKLARTLKDQGWTASQYDSIEYVLNDYYEEHEVEKNTSTEVSSLPSMLYIRNEEGMWIETMGVAIKEEVGAEPFDYSQEVQSKRSYDVLFENRDIKSYDTIISKAIKEHFDFVIILQTQDDYYHSS